MEGLQRWVKEVVPNIRLHPLVEWQTQGEDWTLKLSEPLPAHSVVLSVPRDLILTSQHEIPEYTMSQLRTKGLSDHARELNLFLQLLDARQNRATLGPWMDSLPQDFSCAIDLCPETEIPHLPLFTQALVHVQRQRFQAFQQIAKDLGHEDETLAKWAFNVVYSRSWGHPGGDSVDIVPVGDMFNHNEPATVVVEYTPDEVQFVTKRPSAGELTLSYGEVTNPHRFLAVFGFAVDETTMPFIWTQLLLDGSAPTKERGSDRFMSFNTQTGEMDESVYHAIASLMVQTQGRKLNPNEDLGKFRRSVHSILQEHFTNLYTEAESASNAETSSLVRRFNAFLTRCYAKAIKEIS